MNRSEQELYQQLSEFPLDDPRSTLRFSYRLARENDWSIRYAERVIDEYRRFLFLAAVAGHTVTPSDQVDQVWHLHLTYTQSYWTELCGDILKRPLHHGPTKGGSAEGMKFHDLYEQTLQSYRTWFVEEPPSDIWPAAEIRFGTDLCYQRVNTQRYWLIPKPDEIFTRVGQWRRHQFAAAAFVPFGLGVANPLDLRGPEFLMAFAVTFVISLVIALAMRFGLRRHWGEREDSGEDPTIDTYEMAYLAGGPDRVTEAATAALVKNGYLRTERVGEVTRLVADQPVPRSIHSVESAVYASLVVSGGAVTGKRYQKFVGCTMNQLHDQLLMKGLIESPRSFAASRWASVLAMTPVLVLGAAKFFVGSSRDKPIGFLVFGLVAIGLTMLWFAVQRPRCSPAGDRMWRDIAAEHDPGYRASLANSEPADQREDRDLAFDVALLGLVAAFDDSDPVTDAFAQKPAAEWGGGGWGGDAGGGDAGGGGCGGGGCGGGGCGGGGCGGCGGCGG